MVDTAKAKELQDLFDNLPDTYKDFQSEVKHIISLDKKGKIDGNKVVNDLITYIRSNPTVTTSDVLKKELEYYKPWEDQDKNRHLSK